MCIGDILFSFQIDVKVSFSVSIWRYEPIDLFWFECQAGYSKINAEHLTLPDSRSQSQGHLQFDWEKSIKLIQAAFRRISAFTLPFLAYMTYIRLHIKKWRSYFAKSSMALIFISISNFLQFHCFTVIPELLNIEPSVLAYMWQKHMRSKIPTMSSM